MHHPTLVALRCAFQLGVFLVVVINSAFISKWYFEYRVIVKAGPVVPFDLAMPKLSLCFSLPSLLSKKPGDFFYSQPSLFLNKKISELKKKTPPEDQVVKECMYRDWQSDSVIFGNRSACAQFFTVNKYVMQSYMCYKLTPAQVNYSYFDVIHTLEQRRFLYQVTVTSPLNAGHKMCPILHSSEVPYYDRVFSQEIIAALNEGSQFSLSSEIYRYSALPSPYTDCNPVSRQMCYTLCMMKQIEKYGLLHYPASMFNTNDSLIMPDFETRYSSRLYSQIHDEAQRVCHILCPPHHSCEAHISVTLATRRPTPKAGSLIFRVETISKPLTGYKMAPDMFLVEFLTQIVSVCSFYLGFSVFSLMAVKLKKPQLSKSLLKQIILARLRVASIRIGLPSGHSDRVNTSPNRLSGPRYISSLIIRSLLIILFTMQLREIFVDYFSYQTTVEVESDDWPLVTAPNLDICLMNRGNESINESGSEIMDNSYSNGQLIAGCRIASTNESSLWALSEKKSSECLIELNITRRYIMDNYFCYGISARNNSVMYQGSKKLAIVHPGLFYSIILNKSVSLRQLRVVLSDGQPSILSIHYSSAIPKRKYNRMYLISNHLRKLASLPSPYDTRCRDLPSSEKCANDCLTNSSLVSRSTFPFGQIIDGRTLVQFPQFNLLSKDDLMNASINRIWSDIETNCRSICDYRSCFTSSFKTSVSRRYRSSHSLELAVDSRASPDELTTVKARSSLYTMIYQILCSANFWLGLVLLDLNPFKCRAKNVKERFLAIISEQLIKLQSELHAVHESISPHTVGGQLFDLAKSKCIQMKRELKCNILFILAIGCSLHLFYCTRLYLSYPTIMISHTEQDESSSSTFELNICSSLIETLAPDEMRAYSNHKTSRSQLNMRLDQFLNNLTMGQMIAGQENKLNSLQSCSFRGIENPQNIARLRESPMNRLFSNHINCTSTFYAKFAPINGFLCYRFGMKRELPTHHFSPLNRPRALMAVRFRMENLTDTLSIVVTKRAFVAYYSSYFAPSFVKPTSSMRIKVSYTKFEQIVLNKPYNNDYETASSLSCFKGCMNSRLLPLGLGVVGSTVIATNGTWVHDFRYPSKHHLQNSKFQEKMSSWKNTCRDRCIQTISWIGKMRTISFTVTLLSEFTSLKSEGREKYMELVLMHTNSPVTTVFTVPQWSLIELIINCCSIIGTWFGVSGLSADPLHSSKDRINHQMVARAKHQLRQIEDQVKKDPERTHPRFGVD